MTLEHVQEVKGKLRLLPEFMQVTSTPIYRDVKPKGIVVVLAAGKFADKAKAAAITEGFSLCYPSGDRYCVPYLNAIRISGSVSSSESVLA